MSGDFGILFALVIKAAFGAGGAAIAKSKNRNPTAWFIVCFIFSLLGLIVIALLRKVTPPQAVPASNAANEPTYDKEKWAQLLASDVDVAAGAEALRPYGEKYVAELASTLLARDGTQGAGPIIEALLARAKAEAEALAEEARLDQIGRNIDSIYWGVRGPLALLKDSRVLAQVGRDFKMFGYVTDYRDLYKDRNNWIEVTDVAEKRRFVLAAREALEAVNASFEQAPDPTASRVTAGNGERKRPPADSDDDLTLIADIDPALVRRLNARGVTRYAHIAAWTSAGAAEIDAALDLRGRIRRENWIGQAKSFISRYERCGACGHVYDLSASPHCTRCPPPRAPA